LVLRPSSLRHIVHPKMALRYVLGSAVPRAVSGSIGQTLLARGMATEKQLAMKLVSTENISKITSSMKMVSAAKLKGDENRLKLAKPFNEWTTAISGEANLLEGATYEELPEKSLIIAMSSDKGLCGGVNSFITRGVKDMVQKLSDQSKEYDVAIIGDKGRAQLSRAIPDKITRSCTEVVSPGTFALSSAIASELLDAGAKDYDALVIVYNTFVNPAVYKQVYKVVKPFKGEGEDEPLMEYEFEGGKAEMLDDLYEYMLTSELYFSFLDGAAAEQSSRMAAMENATKNAGEMIDSLRLQYNRARQARITTELIEIISGASALEG